MSNPNPNKKQEKPVKEKENVAAAGGSTGVEQQKSKADLRRERNAKQEEQRAKKAAGATSADKKDTAKATVPAANKSKVLINKPESNQQTESASSSSNIPIEPPQPPVNTNKTATNNKPVLKKTETSSSVQHLASYVINKSKLFHHFDQYKRDYSIVEKFSIDNPKVHPVFIKLGIQYAHDEIIGSTARCLAFLNAFTKFLIDYKTPSNESKDISKDLEAKLKPNINFLTQCRPLSISMGNAIKELKQLILHFDSEITDVEAKRCLNEEIERFIDEKILLAWETISKYMLANSEVIISGTSYVKSKITNSDCILIYGSSSLVSHVLIQASQKFLNMHIIVVDSRPNLRGKIILEQLVKNGIQCSYIMINAVSFVMNRVTKVILGAHALLANGYVMSSIGSSQIALVAKSFNVPVVVCCETYKFCDKVQTDALVNNELGNPMNLLNYSSRTQNQKSPLAHWTQENKETENINILNLVYDVTPPDLISCVVTDIGMLPCTSVPVVLRLRQNQHNYNKQIKHTSKASN